MKIIPTNKWSYSQDEHCTHEGKDKIVWWLKCPKCGKQTPTPETIDGKIIDY